MRCEDIEILFSPYLDQDLKTSEKMEVDRHLQTCASCRKQMDLLKIARRSLAAIPEVEIGMELMRKLHAIPEKKKKPRFSLDFFLKPSLQPIMVAGTIFLTAFSFYAFNPNRASINKAIDRRLHLSYSKIEKLYAKAESFTYSLGSYKDYILLTLKNASSGDKDED